MRKVVRTMLEVQKLAIISTSHISEQTSNWLDRRFDEDPGPNGGRTPFGYFLYVPSEDNCIDTYPQDLLNVFAFARSHGIYYLYLDRDGEPVDDLETFDW